MTSFLFVIHTDMFRNNEQTCWKYILLFFLIPTRGIICKYDFPNLRVHYIRFICYNDLALIIFNCSGLPGLRGSPGAQGPPGFCEFCNYPGSNYVASLAAQRPSGNVKGPWSIFTNERYECVSRINVDHMQNF